MINVILFCSPSHRLQRRLNDCLAARDLLIEHSSATRRHSVPRCRNTLHLQYDFHLQNDWILSCHLPALGVLHHIRGRTVYLLNCAHAPDMNRPTAVMNATIRLHTRWVDSATGPVANAAVHLLYLAHRCFSVIACYWEMRTKWTIIVQTDTCTHNAWRLENGQQLLIIAVWRFCSGRLHAFWSHGAVCGGTDDYPNLASYNALVFNDSSGYMDAAELPSNNCTDFPWECYIVRKKIACR